MCYNENMSKKIYLIKEISLIALSFVIPFVLLIILFNSNGIALGGYKGDTTIMIDLQSQYIAYMRDFRNILINHESLIYTNSKIFGGDYMSIFTYYLSSPFNYFVVFFKEEALPLFFIWSSILKMAFASLNFYLLMRFTRKISYTHLIGAIGYGLISYSFIYLSNYMWLDGMMILPLVVLGLEYLGRKKHYWIYPLALAYALMTSWYIGFMIAIFCVIYFIHIFVKYFSKEDKGYLKLIICFAVFSLAAGLLSSSYWLTAFLHLSGTKGSAALPGMKWFSISSFLSGLLENNYANHSLITQNNSYISMFVGVVPLVFFITYFFNKEYKLQDRLTLLGIILLYFLLSSNTVLSALMHGGREPTWFPGRYSFIIGFIVCYIASLSLDEAHKLNPLYYLVPTFLGLVVILIVKFTKHSDRLNYYQLSIPSVVMYFVTIAFATGISLCYYFFNKKEKLNKYICLLPSALSLLLIVQVISSYRGGDKVFKVNNQEQQYQDYETYLKDCEYQSSFDAIKQYEIDNGNNPFYRMEATFNRPGNYNSINNNPMFYSYNGLSNYSSSSKKKVESYLKKVGYQYNNFFGKFEAGSTYSMSSLLGVKYLLEDKEAITNIHPYYLDYNTFNPINVENCKIDAYFNKNAVNLGFLSDKTSLEYISEGYRAESGNIYWYDKFEYQNQIFKTLVKDINEDIFKPLPQTTINTTTHYETDEFGIRTFKDVKKGAYIRIGFNIPEEAKNLPVYFSEKDMTRDITYYVDDTYIPINTYYNSGIRSFRPAKRVDHSLIIRFNRDFDSVMLRPELYYEDLNVAQHYVDSLKENELIIDEVNNSLTKKAFVGHINIINNIKDLIFTIPNEQGISVYVDGKKAKTMTKMNIFTAIDLSQYEIGEHKITIQYQDKGFVLSLPITIMSILGIVPLVIFYNKIENKIFKKKEENS